MRSKFLILFLFFATGVVSAQNQPNPGGALPEVVIRSTPIIDTLQRISASVSVVVAEDLRRGDPLSFASELNKLPGIQMQQGALNTSRLVIRGVGARSQYSTNRVKAYLEGIPLTTGEGETTLEDIDLNLIDRMEIIKGPAASSYGAGLGGAINLSVRKPEDGENFLTTYGNLGSYGLFRSGATTGFTGRKHKTLLSFNHLEKDGFRENSGYNRNTVTLFTEYRIAEKHKLSLFANYTNLKAFIPSSLNAEDFQQNPETAAFTWGQARGYESYDKALAGLSYTVDFTKNSQWQTSFFTNYRDGYEPRPFDILDEESVAFGVRSVFRSGFDVFGIPAKATAGVEYYDENYSAVYFENLYESNSGNGSLPGDLISDQEQDRKYLNLFAQLSFQLSEKLKTEFGLSYNHSRYNLDDGRNPSNEDRSGKYTYPRLFLPQAGLTYELVPEKFIYASVSRGFSIPTVQETLTPEGAINPDIQPEIGVNYEMGLKASWFSKKLYTELALYSLQVNDLLVAERVGQDRYVGRNAGKTDHNGIEFLFNFNQNLSGNWMLKPYGALSINSYSFDDFTDNENTYDGNDLTGVPDQVYQLGVDLAQQNGFRFNLSYLHTGSIPLNDANTLYSDSYNLVNLRADYVLDVIKPIQFQIYGGINNLLDTKYASQILPNAVGFGQSAPRFYYPGEPVNFYLGLRATLSNQD